MNTPIWLIMFQRSCPFMPSRRSSTSPSWLSKRGSSMLFTGLFIFIHYSFFFRKYGQFWGESRESCPILPSYRSPKSPISVLFQVHEVLHWHEEDGPLHAVQRLGLMADRLTEKDFATPFNLGNGLLQHQPIHHLIPFKYPNVHIHPH